jgi:hypothetical protein
MPIGPSLPPHLAHLANKHAGGPSPASDDEDDDYTPALPPHLAASRGAGPSRPPPNDGPGGYSSPSPPRIRKVLPLPVAEDSDDDDIGPRLESAPAPQRSAAEEFREREERRAKLIEEQSKPKVLQREEWMLVPPSSGVLSNGEQRHSPLVPGV